MQISRDVTPSTEMISLKQPSLMSGMQMRSDVVISTWIRRKFRLIFGMQMNSDVIIQIDHDSVFIIW